MPKFHPIFSMFAASLLLTAISGCGRVLHELNPSRLQQWNRGPNLYNDDFMFSVSDALDDAGGTPERVKIEQSQMEGKTSSTQNSSP